MEKDIYIITNTLNNYVYIGQSVNAIRRWSAHKSSAKANKATDHSLLHKAMRELGIENFSMKVLERVFNYNEREKYYIEKYNSITPNGYNLTRGGAGLPRTIPNEVELIKRDILESTLKLQDIAKKYNVDKRVVTSINRGLSYKDGNLQYPLRKRDNDILSINNLLTIRDLLVNSTLSIREIARRYNCNTSIIRDVNMGKKVLDDTIIYPIRNNRPEYVDLIIDDILNTNLSFRAIARKYNVSNACPSMINNGNYYFNPNFSYPLRQTPRS